MPDPWEQDLGESMWVAGADYISEWAQAREAARDLAAVLESLGLTEAVHVSPGTGHEGAGTVRLRASPEAARVLSCALRRLEVSLAEVGGEERASDHHERKAGGSA
jgi:hypothetical protein